MCKKTVDIKEIIRGDIHCFSNCGCNCKAAVKVALERHYQALADTLPGWTVKTWHNTGWHCCLQHESGFELRGRSIFGGVSEGKHCPAPSEARFYCNNYGGEYGGQVLEYGSTPKAAIQACADIMAERATEYTNLINKLKGKNHESR